MLCHTASALADLCKREFGKTIAFDDISTFDLSVSFGLDQTELDHLMVRGHQPEVLAAMEPIEGALEALSHWTMNDYPIAVVTGRPPSSVEASLAWLDHHAVPYSELTFVDKYGRADHASGNATALSLETLFARPFALAIEDAPQMAARLLRHTTLPVALLERPWNRSETIAQADNAHRLHRCRDWPHVMQRFAAP